MTQIAEFFYGGLRTLQTLPVEAHLECMSEVGGIGLTIAGLIVAWLGIDRPNIFRFKLSMVFLLPAICAFGYIVPEFRPSPFYTVAYISTFIILLNLLYWRELRYMGHEMGEQESAITSILSAIPDVVWVKDPEGRYTFTSDTIHDSLILCDRNEICGKKDEDMRQDGVPGPLSSIFECGCGLNNPEGSLVATGTPEEPMILRVFRAPIYITDHEGVKSLWGVMGVGQNMTPREGEDWTPADKVLSDGIIRQTLT